MTDKDTIHIQAIKSDRPGHRRYQVTLRGVATILALISGLVSLALHCR